MWQHTCMPYTFMFQSFWSCVKLWHILISRAWRNIMWLPKITLDLLITEELLLYDNFKRNVEFNFWKQMGMKGWNRDTIVVTVLVQVTKQCKHCNNQTCCSHLIKWDSKWVPNGVLGLHRVTSIIFNTFYHQVFLVTIQCVAKLQSYS